jgi:hypothetical protein
VIDISLVTVGIVVAAILAVAWARHRWRPFDPSELVALARETLPDQTWVADALSRCTRARVATRYNVYFVNADRPNQPGSEWQFRENVVLESPVDGDIIIDVLQDGRIGSLSRFRKF